MTPEERKEKSQEIGQQIIKMFSGLPVFLAFQTLETTLISLYLLEDFSEEDAKKRMNNLIEISFR